MSTLSTHSWLLYLLSKVYQIKVGSKLLLQCFDKLIYILLFKIYNFCILLFKFCSILHFHPEFSMLYHKKNIRSTCRRRKNVRLKLFQKALCIYDKKNTQIFSSKLKSGIVDFRFTIRNKG